jgi:hypothetical protein
MSKKIRYRKGIINMIKLHQNFCILLTESQVRVFDAQGFSVINKLISRNFLGPIYLNFHYCVFRISYLFIPRKFFMKYRRRPIKIINFDLRVKK